MAFTENKGVRIFWRENGEGAPLLLMMGLGYTSEMWHHIEPALARHHRLIMFDNRGVGKSDVPPGPYPIATMAADAAAVLDAAGVETAHVFGISMGGYIAQEFALQYPHRVGALILGCTACGGEKAVPAAPRVMDLLQARKTMPPSEGVRALIPVIYDPATPRERVDADIEIRLRTYPSPEGYGGQLDGIYLWESFGRLMQLQARTLVVHGEHDQLVPPANGRFLAEMIPNARLVMLPDASHIFFTDQPEKTAAVILEFLKDKA